MNESLLIEHARTAASHAYAPYSHFTVGAAIMADDGRIFVGCNVENASYSIGCCAERHAIGAAIVAGASKWSRIVVAAPRPVWPCGMCLQALAEFATPDFEIIAVDMQGKAKQRTTLGALLPQAFRLTSTAESD